MPRRERFQRTFKCPKCEKEGTAIFEENETPPHHQGDFDTRLEEISDGFYLERNAEDGFDIVCKGCKIRTIP